jgi:hypothetical protein
MEKAPEGRRLEDGIEGFRAWQVEEVFSEAKDSDRGSEDGHFESEDCVVVFDGVSSVDSLARIDGLTPGQFAVKVGLREIAEHPPQNPRNIVRALSDALKKAREHAPVGTPSFVFVAFFPKHNTIVRVGDCSYLIDGKGVNPEIPPDVVASTSRRVKIEDAMQKGATDNQLFAHVPAHSDAVAWRTYQSHLSNNPQAGDMGYGVIDGRDVPDQYVEYIPVPEDARTVVLASDGYPPSTLRESLAESEEALRKLQEKDPLGIYSSAIRALKPTKEGQTATDDRTYVRVARA